MVIIFVKLNFVCLSRIFLFPFFSVQKYEETANHGISLLTFSLFRLLINGS